MLVWCLDVTMSMKLLCISLRDSSPSPPLLLWRLHSGIYNEKRRKETLALTSRCTSLRIRKHHNPTATSIQKLLQRRLHAIMTTDRAAKPVEGDGLADTCGGELCGGCAVRRY